VKKGMLFLATILMTAIVFSVCSTAGEKVSFDQRVRAQEAIERVYYDNRIWPADNKAAKPSFDEMFTRDILARKVTGYLKRSHALGQFWQQPLEPAMIQEELDRIVRESEDPSTLRELFGALGDDPEIIAECLVRPILADRVLRSLFFSDADLHRKERASAEDAMAILKKGGSPGGIGCTPELVRYTLGTATEEIGQGFSIPLSGTEFKHLLERTSHSGISMEERQDAYIVIRTLAAADTEITVEKYLFPKKDFEGWWRKVSSAMTEPPLPETGSFCYAIREKGQQLLAVCQDDWLDTSLDDIPDPRYGHTAVWTGTEMIVWGGGNNSGGRYNPATDSWVPTSRQSGVPSARYYHTAVWTGSEMIIWGGTDGTDALQNGGRYNPAADSWTPTSLSAPCPSARKNHTAVWSGTEMIVWSGSDTSDVLLNDGGKYDPATDIWSAVSTLGPCPEVRQFATAVFISGEMVVWGGSAAGDVPLNTGGRYNPASDIWISATSTSGACPAARRFHTAVAGNGEMMVWGGEGTGLSVLGNGSSYNPASDTWTAISGTGAPSARRYHTAVWTTSLMIVWGGEDGSSSLQSGSRYDPSSGTWTATPTTGSCPTARYQHTAVWTGADMIIWGGYWPTNSGGKYNLSGDSWTATSLGTNVPAGRQYHTAVWTGSEMIVWGGESLGPTIQLNSGGRYTPATDSWAATSTLSPCPVGRRNHTAVWTGTDMIVWGGDYYDGTDHFLNTGGLYNPGTDMWSATAASGAPVARRYHTAVWTGTEMIIWGGHSGAAYLNSGSRFDPATSSWTATFATGAPTVRQWHTAVWTGTYMIIWGGFNGAAGLNNGSCFNPTLNNWTAVATGGPTIRYHHTAVWAPQINSMIVWGGGTTSQVNTGSKYNPTTAKWTAMTATDAPSARWYHSAVWTGQEMLVWGGQNGAISQDDGYRYNAYANTWTQMSKDPGFPTPRFVHAAVWNDTVDSVGTKMIVWGGSGAYSSGGVYEPPPQVVGFYEACGEGPVELSTAVYDSYQWLKDGIEIEEATRSGMCDAVSGGGDSTVTNLTPAVEFTAGDAGRNITIDGQECLIKTFVSATTIVIDEVLDRTNVPWSILDKTAHGRSYMVTETGDYNVRVSKDGGATFCEGVPHHVDIWGWPTPEITGDTVGCETPGVVLATGSYSAYQWILDGGDILNATSQNYTAKASGNYQVRVTDSHGCVGTSGIFPVTVHPNPLPTIAPTPQGCPTLLSTEPWVTYRWLKGTTEVGTSATYLATSNGSYTVEVTDTNGCAGVSAPYVVSNYPAPVITGPATGCEGSFVTLSTVLYASYQWYRDGVIIPGALGQTYDATVSGSYTVEVTDALGCTGISPAAKVVTFYPPPAPTITGPTETVCVANLSTGTYTYYQWILDGTDIPGATAKTYTTTVSGTYNVRVTDSRGCVGTSADFIVSIFPLPSPPTVLGPTSGCSETGVTLSTGVYSTYQWYANGTLIPGATTQNYLTTETGFNYYSVSVTDLNGCAASSSVGHWVNLDPPRPDVYIGPDKNWTANSTVHAIAKNGPTLYLGGEFTYLGPYSGSGVVMDTATGNRDASWPRVDGSVNAIAPDGAGGFYMGGSFTKVGGFARSNFVHLKADKSVDQDFTPSVNNTVWAVLVVGTKVYIGGEFTIINTQTRNRIACLDSVSGQLTAWNPNMGNFVYALAEYGDYIYAGGMFTTVGGTNYNRLAAIDKDTALPASWNPNVAGTVRAVKVLGTRLFIGGDFTSASATTRNRVAAYDLLTGTLISDWNPNSGGNVYSMAVYDDTVYIGGLFTTVNGQTRNHVAALDATATATPWVTFWQPEITGITGTNVTALEVSSDGATVYAGGFFTTVKGTAARANLASIEASTGNPTSFNPVVPNQVGTTTCVKALCLVSSNLAVGGDFTMVNGVSRNRIASIDTATGQATSWDPNITAASGTCAVYALALHGGNLYVGGAFTAVGGSTTRNRIASFNTATGELNTWDGNAASTVRSLLVSGDTLYVGGEFLTMSGSTRNRLASFDLTTGLLTSFYPNMNGVVRTLGISGTTLYAGGDFTTIGGTGGSTRNRLAAIDTATGLPTSWNPSMGGIVRAVLVGDGVIYAGGDFTSVNTNTTPVTRNRIAAIDPVTGFPTGWNPASSASVYCLSVSENGSVIYAGGSFITIGGASRSRIAAIDAVEGTSLANWDPGADGTVYTMLQNPPVLMFGGSFVYSRGVKHQYTGGAPLATTQCDMTIELSTDSFAGYQWIQDGATITGATAQTYTASDPGLFKVSVTRNGGCIGESSELRLWTMECGGPSCTAPSDRIVETVSAGSITWPDIAGADFYRVVRAVRADLAGYNFGCFAGSYGIASGAAGADISLHDPSGEAGRCYYYIVQGYDCDDPDEYLGPAGDGVVDRTLAATTCDGD